ncbi:MAG: hypothetical protein ACNA8W_16920, partial [Bradymonadaceae bacterium]
MQNPGIFNPTRSSNILLLLGCSLILTMACGDDSASRCETTTDCFQGEVCLEQVCVDSNSTSTNHGGEMPNSETQNNETLNNETQNNETQNNETQNNETPNSETQNNETQNNETSNTGSHNNTDPTLACVVNSFTATCDDPEEKVNDSWLDAVFLNDRKRSGCPIGDELIPYDDTYSGVLCHNEPADWLHLEVVHCRTKSFNVEITLTPQTECSSELIHLSIAGRDCEDENIYC